MTRSEIKHEVMAARELISTHHFKEADAILKHVAEQVAEDERDDIYEKVFK